MSNQRQALVDNVNHYVKQLNAAVAELDRFDSLPENHVYPSMDVAKKHLWEWLKDKADADCERYGNALQDQYTQEFSADGQRFRALLVVTHALSAKGTYYVDRYTFSVIQL